MADRLYLTVALSILIAISFCDPCCGQTVPQLPAPTGQYAVGRQLFAWTDETRHEPTSEDLALRRELVVYVWYPAAAPTSEPASYLEAAQLRITAFGNTYASAWKAVQDGAIKTHTWKNAKLPVARRPFPLLVFSPGLGSPTAAYTFLLESPSFSEELISSVLPYSVTRLEAGSQSERASGTPVFAPS